MSASSSIVARSGNQFFDQLPNDAVRSVFEFLKGENGSIPLSSPADDRTTVATVSVCKNWQNNPTLREERQEGATRLHQRAALQNVHDQMIEREYPPKMVELLRSRNLNIRQLPVLDVKVRHLFFPATLRTDHEIDYTDCNKENLTHPIMKFKTEDNRPGLVFHIQELDKRIVRLAGQKILFPGEDSALAIYKASPDPQDQSWEYAWRRGATMIGAYKKDQDGVKAHLSHLFTASPHFGDIDHAFLSQVITNKNRSYRIFSEEEPQRHPVGALAHTFSKKSMIVSAEILAIVAVIYFKNQAAQ